MFHIISLFIVQHSQTCTGPDVPLLTGQSLVLMPCPYGPKTFRGRTSAPVCRNRSTTHEKSNLTDFISADIKYVYTFSVISQRLLDKYEYNQASVSPMDIPCLLLFKKNSQICSPSSHNNSSCPVCLLFSWPLLSFQGAQLSSSDDASICKMNLDILVWSDRFFLNKGIRGLLLSWANSSI